MSNRESSTAEVVVFYQGSHAMSESPTDSTGIGSDEDLQGGEQDSAERRAEEADSDLVRGEDVSAGDDGVGGGNESRSSVLDDTLGAGGDRDEVDRGL